MRKESATKGLIWQLLAEQHSLPLSIMLHLVPGVIVVAVYMLISAPFVQAIGYPPYLGWVIALCLTLFPVELGALFCLGWKRNRKPSLRGILHYTDKPVKREGLTGIIVALIVSVFVASALLSPVDTAVYQSLFSWIPFKTAGGAGGYLSGYAHSTVITTLAASLILTGLILPIVEEVYFRGYLLPRLSRLGKCAPVLNTVLFSLYHFWTPWQFISRIGFFLPTVWFTWRKQNLRISLWVHFLANTIVQSLVLIAILLGADY
jgi:membrane protease YdiL (CAAX protease family)